MPVLTRALLRKRAEHNEGIVATLEEISLHQEELENINEVLGATCRKLKILYLQNNIIPKIENLVHLKDLEYLNLALNNIAKIEGLQNCEFLKKLDLTVNFIDVDTLADSIGHLAALDSLRDLFMMGNPSEVDWPGFKPYVIARLPQLATLDGTEITRSMQITARQQLPKLEVELSILAAKKREEKRIKTAATAAAAATTTSSGGKHSSGSASASADAKTGSSSSSSNEVEVIDVESDEDDENEVDDSKKLTDNTPETRVEIYRELAQQKKEKEDKENANKPRERDYVKEQLDAVAAVRTKENETSEVEIKQKNEGGWNFRWDEETKRGVIILEVDVAKYMDSSLIDVDVHPTYVSVIIKSKVLRLKLPAEVKVVESKCQRSKATGSLMVIMPKVNPKEAAVTIRTDIKSNKNKGAGTMAGTSTSSSRTTIKQPKKLSIQEQMLADAMQQSASLVSGADGSNSGGSSSSGSSSSARPLLEVQGPSNRKIVDVANIVRKPREEEEPLSTAFTLAAADNSTATTATATNIPPKIAQIVEID